MKHWTLPPLLTKVVMSLVFCLMGRAADDLRPVKDATMLACTGAVRLTEATVAAEETMEEAISFKLNLLAF